jgi:hypothetical protein
MRGGRSILLFFAALGVANAQPGASPFGETSFFAGEVRKGERVVHSFVFRNPFEAPLEIRSVAPT